MTDPIPSMIKNLRKLLVESTEFEDIGNAFYDLCDQPAFLGIGKPAEDDIFKAMIKMGLTSLYGNADKLRHSLCFHIPQYKLFHGPLDLHGKPGTLFYFSDMDKGMMMVMGDGGKTEFLRLSTTLVKPGVAVANPKQPAEAG